MKKKDDGKTKLIFLATLRLCTIHGLGGITMGKIAKEANLATGTIYIYFKSKEDLITKLYLSLKEDFAKEVFADISYANPFKMVFKQVWSKLLVYKTNNHSREVFFKQFYRSTYINEDIKAFSFKKISPLVKLIEKGKQEFIFKDIHSNLIITYIMGFIEEIVNLNYVLNKDLSENELDQAFTMCWDGLKS